MVSAERTTVDLWSIPVIAPSLPPAPPRTPHLPRGGARTRALSDAAGRRLRSGDFIPCCPRVSPTITCSPEVGSFQLISGTRDRPHQNVSRALARRRTPPRVAGGSVTAPHCTPAPSLPAGSTPRNTFRKDH